MTEKNDTNEFKRPDFFKGKSVFLGKSVLTATAVITLIEILILSMAYAVFYPEIREDSFAPVKEAVGWDTLRIDGNRDSNFVLFDHAIHRDTIGQTRKECRTCHHLSLPFDGPSTCTGCHRSMNTYTLVFDHASHQLYHSAKNDCFECHADNNKAKENAKACTECHPEYTEDVMKPSARSYQAAMHSACVVCHKTRDKEAGIKKHSACKNCHPDQDYTDYNLANYLQ